MVLIGISFNTLTIERLKANAYIIVYPPRCLLKVVHVLEHWFEPSKKHLSVLKHMQAHTRIFEHISSKFIEYLKDKFSIFV